MGWLQVDLSSHFIYNSYNSYKTASTATTMPWGSITTPSWRSSGLRPPPRAMMGIREKGCVYLGLGGGNGCLLEGSRAPLKENKSIEFQG